jgi:hypothetical protein
MKTSAERRTRDENLLQELIALNDDRFELWRYYADRADKFAEQLWTTGTWMLGIVSAVLALPFVAQFITVEAKKIVINAPFLSIVICLFGLLANGYAYFALNDLREHIERNWERADLARTSNWASSHWGGRKLHGWRVLMSFCVASTAAFLAIILIALF